MPGVVGIIEYDYGHVGLVGLDILCRYLCRMAIFGLFVVVECQRIGQIFYPIPFVEEPHPDIGFLLPGQLEDCREDIVSFHSPCRLLHLWSFRPPVEVAVDFRTGAHEYARPVDGRRGG